MLLAAPVLVVVGLGPAEPTTPWLASLAPLAASIGFTLFRWNGRPRREEE